MYMYICMYAYATFYATERSLLGCWIHAADLLSQHDASPAFLKIKCEKLVFCNIISNKLK